MEATESPGFFKRLFMNPLAVRELRVACRSWKLVIILTAYLLIQGAIFAIWLYVQSNTKGMYEDPTSIGSGLFITMSIVLVAVVMLVFPAFSSTAIASEHEKKSFDLLLLTPLSPWEIALGKFSAAALQSSIFIIATIPLFAIASLFGGIQPSVFFAVLWVLILFSIFISFVGVYASSLVKKAIPAVLVTYAFAFVIGLTILIIFIVLTVARTLVSMIAPTLMNMFDPTLSEGVFYVCAMTATWGIYCSFLFISTTNRLKPSSHNKSTALRLLWTVAAIEIPIQFAIYYIAVRIAAHDSAYGGLIMIAVYFTFVMMVPALTAPGEPPVASRRVRREIEKLNPAINNKFGRMFFPGGDRGVVHTTLITVLGLVLLVGTAWVCFDRLDARLEDKATLTEDYRNVMGMDNLSMFTAGPGGGPTPNSAMAAAAKKSDSELRELVRTFEKHEFNGFIALLVVLGVTLLMSGQITWRLTLSGISKALSSLLTGLIIVVWLIVPFITQMIATSGVEPEDAMVAQFSPIAGGMNAVSWGKQSARAAIAEGTQVKHLESSADAFQWRWVTYAATSAAIAAGLLVLNLASRRKVLERVKQLSEGNATPEPVQATEAQLQQVLAAVTAPEATAAVQQPIPPAVPPTAPPPDDLPDFDQVITDDKPAG